MANTSSENITKNLIQIIIEICKQSKIKTIFLTDRSYFRCNNPKFTFFLKQANTLTSGQPYYYNYGMSYQAKLDKATSASGFKFTDINDHSNVKTNATVLSSLKTSDLNFKLFEELIKKRLEKYKTEFDNQIINDTIEYVKEIYNKYLNKSITKFLSKLKYKLCVVFSVIYFDLFELLGLKNYRTESRFERN